MNPPVEQPRLKRDITTKENFPIKAAAIFRAITEKYPNQIYAFDYSEMVWNGSNKDVMIRCIIHGYPAFMQIPTNHLKGYSKCPECKGPNGATRTFIIRYQIAESIKLHGNKYDYSKIFDYNPQPTCVKSNIPLICRKCNYEFINTFDGHQRNNGGCIRCANKAKGESNKVKRHISLRNVALNYPVIPLEWNPSNILKATEVAPKSHERVDWICPLGHSYDMIVSNRTSGQNCSVCSSRKLHPDNSLATNPDAVSQWDYSKNDGKTPFNFFKGGGQTVNFICDGEDCEGNRLNHSFSMKICNFNTGERCGYCAGKKCSPEHSITSRVPLIRNYWDYELNINIDLGNVVYGSGKHYWLKCVKCLIPWKTSPNNISRNGICCPKCNPSGYSMAAMRWLETFENFHEIQHAKSENKEFRIPETRWHADGYCERTNTIYEFHGTFWHGDPRVYSRDDMNPLCKTTYGMLYDRTIEREKSILSRGFNIVKIWEKDFREAERTRAKLMPNVLMTPDDLDKIPALPVEIPLIPAEDPYIGFNLDEIMEYFETISSDTTNNITPTNFD